MDRSGEMGGERDRQTIAACYPVWEKGEGEEAGREKIRERTGDIYRQIATRYSVWEKRREGGGERRGERHTNCILLLCVGEEGDREGERGGERDIQIATSYSVWEKRRKEGEREKEGGGERYTGQA